MFSSLFGKRRSSPTEDDTPPIPGPRADDGFVVVDPAAPGNNIYPSISGPTVPLPQRPAPAPPRQLVDFHYLQGVPFCMNKILLMATNKDAFAAETTDLLAFLTSKVNMNGYDYDFSVEKSVLKEC